WWGGACAARGAAFLAMGLVSTVRRRDWVGAAIVPTGRARDEAPGPTSYGRAMLLLAGLFLLAAGLEATAGDWSYTQLTIGRAVSTGIASWGATLFWAGLAAGRVALGVL